MSKGYLDSFCRLLSLSESAALVGVTEPTFRRFMRLSPQGFPQAFRPGKKIYFRRAELEKWILGSAGETAHQMPATDVPKAPLQVKRARGRPRKKEKEVPPGQEC